MPFLARELLCGLTSAEWKVWCVIFSHCNREMFSCLKNETVIAESGLGKNAYHEAKRGLIEKRWLENCGQKSGRGANVYKILIAVPHGIEKIKGELWDWLNSQQWWTHDFGKDSVSFSDDHFDWLVYWRIVCALKNADEQMRADGESEPWRPDAPISKELRDMALEFLTGTFAKASANLNDERGEWWLFRDGFDEAMDSLKSGTLGSPKQVIRHP